MHMAGVELVALSDAQQRKVWLRRRKKTTAPEEGLGCVFLGGAIWSDLDRFPK